MFTSVSKSLCEVNNNRTFLCNIMRRYSSGSKSEEKPEKQLSYRSTWFYPLDEIPGKHKDDVIIDGKTRETHRHPLDYIQSENRDPQLHAPYLLFTLSKAMRLNYPQPTFARNIKNILHYIYLKDQLYRPQRLEALGPDLAAAHFVVCRGGGVKFVGQNQFIRSKINKSYMVLPNEKNDTYKVEAIDASRTHLLYEGLKNLCDLKYLKWISFSQCSNFNNWYLDYLSSIAPNLEYLDISFCKNIDHHAFGCFYRFRKLKCINVEGISDSDLFKLACLTLESESPDLIVVGMPIKKRPKTVFMS